ncbi:MAG: hypothetical protein Q9200_003640, partial [Gallowayella weberi]
MVHTSATNHDADDATSDDEALLDASEAAEVVPDDPDHPMESDEEGGEAETAQEEIQLHNDSIAHFDLHSDSIYCIANHPLNPNIIATGGGDDTTYVFDAHLPSPVLPPSYESNPSATRSSLQPVAKLQGHTDSVNAITYTLPSGKFLITGGLDGRLRVHSTTTTKQTYPLFASAQEVPEINFLVPCPHPAYPDTFALGANDGSVWVYHIDEQDKDNHLQVIQAYYLHTESCTAGAWTPDGKLLVSVSEEGSLYVWDPFGEAAEAGIKSLSSGQAVVSLTAADQRFATEGGLFSVAVSPSGAFAAVGGAHGIIRIVGLPLLNTSTIQAHKSSGAPKNTSGGKKQASGDASSSSRSQAGQILASLQIQSESIETLAFSPQHSLLAAGSVDGSIVLFDSKSQFAVRRHIKEAHEEFAVVKVAFGAGVGEDGAWVLTSCGMDGV